MEQVIGTAFFVLLIAGLAALFEQTNRRTARFSPLAHGLIVGDDADLRRVRAELDYRASDESAPGTVDAPVAQQVSSPAQQSRDSVALVA